MIFNCIFIHNQAVKLWTGSYLYFTILKNLNSFIYDIIKFANIKLIYNISHAQSAKEHDLTS